MAVVTKACASFVEYQGKEIYHVDYSERKVIYDLIDAVDQASIYSEIHIKNYNKKDILLLIDLSNSFVFGKAVEMLDEFIQKLAPITKKRAVVGLKKSKMIFLNMLNSVLNKDIKAFDNIEEAKEWLVE